MYKEKRKKYKTSEVMVLEFLKIYNSYCQFKSKKLIVNKLQFINLQNQKASNVTNVVDSLTLIGTSQVFRKRKKEKHKLYNSKKEKKKVSLLIVTSLLKPILVASQH